MAGNETFRIDSMLSSPPIIPIDFNNILELPESHAWIEPNSGHQDSSISRTLNSDNLVVPVIDMNDSDNAILLMRNAIEEWGMFQVINHGIDTELLKKMEDETRKLFALPWEQKLKALRDGDVGSGYGVAQISPFFDRLMWSEGFSFRGPLSQVTARLWPEVCDTSIAFTKVISESDKEMKGLSHKIFTMLLASLDLAPKDDVKWYMPNFDTADRLLQMNSYPVCPDPNQAMGLAPHTDSSLLTLLYQSNTSGLQVYYQDKWVKVEPIEGAIVVNAGDLLTILSNGIFKSALHRATVNSRQHRFSVALFLGPPEDVYISSPKKLIKPGELPLYKSVTWKHYLNAKSMYFDKTLDNIRTDNLKKVEN